MKRADSSVSSSLTNSSQNTWNTSDTKLNVAFHKKLTEYTYIQISSFVENLTVIGLNLCNEGSTLNLLSFTRRKHLCVEVFFLFFLFYWIAILIIIFDLNDSPLSNFKIVWSSRYFKASKTFSSNYSIYLW